MKGGKDTVPLVLRELGAQAGQVDLVAVQAPRVKASSLHLAPICTFHQRGGLGTEVAVGAQQHLGCAVVRKAFEDSHGSSSQRQEGSLWPTAWVLWHGL